MLALLPRRFLRDGVDILAKPVTDNCNFSVSLNKFLRNLILEKDKPIFKKCWKQMSLITGLYPFCQYFYRSFGSCSRTSN